MLAFCGRVRNDSSLAMAQASHLSFYLKNTKAVHHLRYGASRRLLMIRWSLDRLAEVIPFGREKPLEGEEVRTLEAALNLLYINICGTLDNLAWTLLHEVPPGTIPKKLTSIGLFQPGITEDTRFADLAAQLATYKSWDEDVRKHRHPAAHRIPLTIPPQTLTGHEAAKYRDLWDQRNEAISKLDFDKADALVEEASGLGTLTAWFLHDPDERPIGVYPQVPNDVAHLLAVFKLAVAPLMRAAENYQKENPGAEAPGQSQS